MKTFNLIICAIALVALTCWVPSAKAQIDNTHPAGNTACSIITATTTACKATAGTLRRVVIGTGVALATVKIYNVASGACTGTPGSLVTSLLVPATVANPLSVEYNVSMSAGVCVITSGATDVVVTYD